MIYKLGKAMVEIGPEVVTTTFVDGSQVTATIAEKESQADIAVRLGITVEAMNRGHDLAHSVLAIVMGLDRSPTLWAVAHGRVYPMWWREESAVLELQAWAAAIGVTIEELAEKFS